MRKLRFTNRRKAEEAEKELRQKYFDFCARLGFRVDEGGIIGKTEGRDRPDATRTVHYSDIEEEGPAVFNLPHPEQIPVLKKEFEKPGKETEFLKLREKDFTIRDVVEIPVEPEDPEGGPKGGGGLKGR